MGTELIERERERERQGCSPNLPVPGYQRIVVDIRSQHQPKLQTAAAVAAAPHTIAPSPILATVGVGVYSLRRNASMGPTLFAFPSQ